MVSKYTFCDVLNKCHNLSVMEENVNKIFRDNGMELTSFSFCAYEDITINLLIDAMGDDADWIGWWVWEADWGSPEYTLDVEVDGKTYDVSTPDKLYDFMIEYYKENN